MRISRDPESVRPSLSAWLALASVFVLPWSEMFAIEGLGTLLKAIVGLALLAFAVRNAARPGKPKVTTLDLAALLFLLWAILSVIWALDLESAFRKLVGFGQGVLVLVVFRRLLSEFEPESVWGALVLGAGVLATLVAYRFISGEHLGDFRYFPEGVDPNEMAVVLAVAFAACGTLVASGGGKAIRLLSVLLIPLLLSAVLLSGSRTGLIAAIAGLVGLMAQMIGKRRYMPVACIAVLVVGAVISAVAFIPEETIKRLLSVGEEFASGSLNQRGFLWAIGIEAFFQDPLIGHGIGSFETISARSLGVYLVAHNTAISVLVELGLIGLVAGAICLLVGVRSIVRSRRLLDSVPMLLALGTGLLALTWEHRPFLWMVSAILMAAADRAVIQMRAKEK